ncbi:hypothetical protein BJ165DRAFT_1492176 [Panaeolus papilionaceus]|nr:hypothetical protein BJ165DRAFT_1492176 [Panaeolus papilionaceus]
MSPITFLDLPYDTIYHIVQQLLSDAEDNVASMKRAATCRRAHRIFDSITCPYLFKKVHVNRLERLQEFRHILEANPKLALYVRSLELHPFAHYDARPVGRRKRDGTTLTFLQNEDIPVILPQLVGLRSFSYGAYSMNVLAWARLSNAMSEAFQNLSLLPSLTHITLEEVSGAPMLWICQFKGLESLTLRSFDCGADNPTRLPDPSRLPIIKELDIKSAGQHPCDVTINNLLRHGLFSVLQKLSVGLRKQGDLYLALVLIRNARTTIEALDIHQQTALLESPVGSLVLSQPETVTFETSLEIHTLSSLRRLKLAQASFLSPDLPSATPLRLQLDFPSPSIEEVHIELDDNVLLHPSPDIARPLGNWLKVDKIFQTKYPALKSLVVKFRSVPRKEINDRQQLKAMELVKSYLPGTVGSRLAEVKVTIQDSYVTLVVALASKEAI